MNKEELVRIFKERLEAFLNVLIDQFPLEKDFVILQLGVRGEMIPPEKTLFNFTKAIIPHKDMVLNKDKEFFLTKCDTVLLSMYSDKLKNKNTNYFKRIWGSETLTEDDRNNLWKWFKLFLNIAIEYDKQS
jgi:hypothetical protein